MTRNVDTIGGGIKTLITFVMRTITNKDTFKTRRRQFVGHIVTEMRKTRTSKDAKGRIGRRSAIKASVGCFPIKSSGRKEIDEINGGDDGFNPKMLRNARGKK